QFQRPAHHAQDSPHGARMVANAGNPFDDGGNTPKGPTLAIITVGCRSAAQGLINFGPAFGLELGLSSRSWLSGTLGTEIIALPLPEPVVDALATNGELPSHCRLFLPGREQFLGFFAPGLPGAREFGRGRIG